MSFSSTDLLSVEQFVMSLDTESPGSLYYKNNQYHFLPHEGPKNLRGRSVRYLSPQKIAQKIAKALKKNALREHERQTLHKLQGRVSLHLSNSSVIPRKGSLILFRNRGPYKNHQRLHEEYSYHLRQAEAFFKHKNIPKAMEFLNEAHYLAQKCGYFQVHHLVMDLLKSSLSPLCHEQFQAMSLFLYKNDLIGLLSPENKQFILMITQNLLKNDLSHFKRKNVAQIEPRTKHLQSILCGLTLCYPNEKLPKKFIYPIKNYCAEMLLYQMIKIKSGAPNLKKFGKILALTITTLSLLEDKENQFKKLDKFLLRTIHQLKHHTSITIWEKLDLLKEVQQILNQNSGELAKLPFSFSEKKDYPPSAQVQKKLKDTQWALIESSLTDSLDGDDFFPSKKNYKKGSQ